MKGDTLKNTQNNSIKGHNLQKNIRSKLPPKTVAPVYIYCICWKKFQPDVPQLYFGMG